MFESASESARCPLDLALACAIAESGLNLTAERIGPWPDVSFGLSQQIVAYHWAGTGENTPENIEYVRNAVFENPALDLYWMCVKLVSCLERANGDYLQALIVYNSGGVQEEGNWYWQRWPGNIANYISALTKAGGMV